MITEIPEYLVTKTYGNEEGLSCVFRQYKAKSHCRFLHGYALGFEITFGCEEDELTPEGWVIDFGSLGPLRDYLHTWFDHTVLLVEDDPLLGPGSLLAVDSYAQVSYLPAVGCEAFAKMVHEWVRSEISDRVISVRCFEHGANSATYQRTK